MLFKELEVDSFKYFKNTAEILNRYFVLNTQNFEFNNELMSLIVKNDAFFNLLKETIILLDTVEINGEEYEGFKGILSNFNYRLENNLKLLYSIPEDYQGCVRNFISILFEFIENFRKWQFGVAKVANKPVSPILDHIEFHDLSISLSKAVGTINKISQLPNENINERFAILENKYNELNELVDNINSFYENKSLDFLDEQKQFLRDKFKIEAVSFRNEVNIIRNHYEFDINIKLLKLKDDLETAEKESENLFGDLKLYKSIVSDSTENEISKHYSLKAEKEKRTYWTATSITASIIIASLGSAWFGLHDYYQNYVSFGSCYADSFYMDDNYKKCVEGLNQIRESTQKFALNYLVMRLIFSVLLFLTVIYTSRIAIRAYSHWRHSESMHLKLASLRPFINQLETKERDQIHKDLVPDYFGKDAGLVDSTNEKFKDLPANVSAVAMKAIEQISGGGSNSSTEKNNKKPESETG
ncbi:hypothetical protein [Acinetobacter pittii]|uniref:hypothetical protein n=1 Tax=Acinetobacter pittii TaxID=48296 RepID=UPI00192AD806|nr:hypothetical protein [Acinetobacter pittii]